MPDLIIPIVALADLYDPLTMPADLRTAHRLNVPSCAGCIRIPRNITEAEIVAKLFEMLPRTH